MRITNKPADALALGITVELLKGETNKFLYHFKSGTYRSTLQIYLPPGLEACWVSGIMHVLKIVQRGTFWPVRFDYENIKQFISIDDLLLMEKALSLMPFSICNAPKEDGKSSISEAAYKKMLNKMARERYHAKAYAVIE